MPLSSSDRIRRDETMDPPAAPAAAPAAPADPPAPAAFYTFAEHWRAALNAPGALDALPAPGAAFADNHAYRAALRALFEMRDDERTSYGDGALQLDPSVPLDAESQDELSFDSARAKRVLHEWFTLTENDPEFLTLYDYSGYRFMQLNTDTGFAALLTFDDLAPFCRALATYLRTLRALPSGRITCAGKHSPELHALLNKYRPL